MMKRILLVDDDKICNFIAESTLNRLGVAKEVHSALNGQEALDLFNGYFQGDVAVPDIIFLDLNMPIMDGREVLAELVKDDDLKQIPVMILTTSSDENDVLSMYKLKCSSYVTKPVDFNQFLNVIQGITNFYFTVVVLPPKS